MSSVFSISPFDPEGENWWSKGTSRLAQRVYHVGLFVRGLRVQMRFGDLTRAPLRMVRLQLKERVAECDWIARLPDPWDEDLRPDIGQRHASLQALKDAVDVRFLLFEMRRMWTPHISVSTVKRRSGPRTYHRRPRSPPRGILS